MRKFILNSSVISAVVGGWSIYKTSRVGPRDWRLALQWVSWAISVAVAIGSVSYDSRSLAQEETTGSSERSKKSKKR